MWGELLTDYGRRLTLNNTDITSLADLEFPTELEVLDLRKTKVTTLEGAMFPSGLRKLYLSNSALISLEKAKLPGSLQELGLKGTNLTSLSGVKLPSGLKRLYLRKTKLSDLEGVQLPKGLIGLDLAGTKLTSLKGVELPPNLVWLLLDGTRITEMDNVSLPPTLCTLSLRGTTITHLPKSIRYLPKLKKLDISNTKLEELPDWLLDLGLTITRNEKGNGLCLYNTTVKGVDMSIFDQSQEMILEWFKEYTKSKRHAYLEPFFILDASCSMFSSSNRINGLSEIHEALVNNLRCTVIDTDSFSYKNLYSSLRPHFGYLSFDFNKYYNAYHSPDSPLLSDENRSFFWICGRYTPPGCFDNEDWNPKTYLPAWNARKPIYLDDVPEEEPKAKESAKPLNELKVVFLGDGGAGKSHTIARLLKDGGQTADFPDISTPGIVIQDKTYPYDDKEVKVHFWDFGGQEILHSMHRMFLTTRTLYVVMLNVRDGTQDDRARYWLYNLRSFAKGAPVLLVLNQMDMNENATLNESDLRKLYPALAPDVVKISTLKYSDGEFEEKFIDVLRRQIDSMDILAFPFIPAWSRLKEKLQNMEDYYIDGDKFREFCDECGVTDSDNIRRDLLNWCSDLGVSFCYSGSASLEDYVVLRPDWITNAIYIVLFNKAETANNGQVSHEVIYKMLSSRDMEKYRRTVTKATYKPHEVDYVLKVFRKFRLSFLAEDGIEFLPMLCEANAKPISATYENDPDALEFRMHYEYLPNNVIHRLMVDRRRELNLSNVWLYGGQFRNDCTGLSAVVKTEGNLLRIMVRRENSACAPQLYLDALKKDIERINTEMGLTAHRTEVVYKQGTVVECFSYKTLLNYQKLGQQYIVSEELGELIPLADILKQSGHSADRAQEKLMTDIVQFCEMLQDNNKIWDGSEDERTTYIRDLLRAKGYIANDQTRGGISGGDGEQPGELDLDIRLRSAERLTIFEALNLSGSSESRRKYWNAHLDKLLDNYNSTGCPFLFHVTYLSCAKDAFAKHCVTFEDHMRYYSPRGFSLTSERPTDPLAKRNIRHGGFLRAMECVYDCGGIPMTVYHFFVRIGE